MNGYAMNVVENMMRLLWRHGLNTSLNWSENYDCGKNYDLRIVVHNVFGILLAWELPNIHANIGIFERMLESKDHPMREEYYQLVLWERPEDFNRLVDVYPLASYDELHAWCDKDENMTKRLWKLRLSRLDPTRWPTFEDVPDVSREELEAMFSGHPSQVQLTDMCEEPPCKRICT